MKAIIFDFNGTLFRDTDFHTKAWKQIYKELHPDGDGGPGEEFYCGPRNDQLLEKIAPWLTFEQRQEMSKYKESVYDDGNYLNKREMHKEAAKRLGIDISECVVIEDSVSAICHAREVGAGYIVAIGSEKKREEICRLPIDGFICDFKEWDYSIIK